VTESSRSVVSTGTIVAAIVMMGIALYLIPSNFPREEHPPAPFAPASTPGSPSLASGAASPPNGPVDFVSGLGVVEPAGEPIVIGSQIPGVVAAVLVQAGDAVKAGQELIRLDDREEQATVAMAATQLAAEQAKLVELQGTVPVSEAKVEEARAFKRGTEAAVGYAAVELQRSERLFAQNATSAEELDGKRLLRDEAIARDAQAAAQLREAIATLDQIAGDNGAPSIDVQKAAVESARANLRQKQVELELHTIRAPKDATVLIVKVHPGEYLPVSSDSSPLMTLGVIAPLHLRVEIDESDIPRVPPDSKAVASVRGAPQQRVPLTFVRVEPYVVAKGTLTGSASERVDTRVQQIIYSVDPSQIRVSPGQQMDVFIDAAARGK